MIIQNITIGILLALIAMQFIANYHLTSKIVDLEHNLYMEKIEAKVQKIMSSSREKRNKHPMIKPPKISKEEMDKLDVRKFTDTRPLKGYSGHKAYWEQN